MPPDSNEIARQAVQDNIIRQLEKETGKLSAARKFSVEVIGYQVECRVYCRLDPKDVFEVCLALRDAADWAQRREKLYGEKSVEGQETPGTQDECEG
jgi:hypothetical protein